MSDQFIGEIRIFPYIRGAPSGWLLCDGSLLQVSEYPPLYSLLTTTYGGDGNETFGIPDLRGRIPIHQGSGPNLSPYALGQKAGDQLVTLTTEQMASHFHLLMASRAEGQSVSPANNLPAVISGEAFYATVGEGTIAYGLPANTIAPAGGGGGHDNTGPTMPLNFCIAWEGIYPSPG